MSRDAERAVLAACIISPIARTEAKRRITGADFECVEHESIWNAINRLERHGKEVGWITVNHVLATDRHALALIPDLVTFAAIPEQTGDYADIVRDAATLRRLASEAEAVLARTRQVGVLGRGLAAKVATRFCAIRDSGVSDSDLRAVSLGELMATPDEPYDWIIPGLIEHSDRLVLTGEEGLGKSHLLRQIAVMAAAGLDPFTERRIAPCKSVVIDCENTVRQVRRKTAPLYDFTRRYGQDPSDHVTVECPGRMDITADKDLARIHYLCDAVQPDIIVIGPLYRLVPRAVQTDDEAAPLLTALDSLRDRGIALLIEAHSGHSLAKHGVRDMRPRGSSALLGWPEFGYGMRRVEGRQTCDFVGWRGDRDQRDWPKRLRPGTAARWVPDETFKQDEVTA